MKKLLAIASLVALTGCQEYLVRSDTVSPYTGNAAVTNRSLQVIDPWPRYVYDTELRTSGERQAGAIRKYHTAHEQKQEAAPVLQQMSAQQSNAAN